ncbi:hypothetical protein BDW72DRAFT_186747 [Aspergillus terricola var. indicus]
MQTVAWNSSATLGRFHSVLAFCVFSGTGWNTPLVRISHIVSHCAIPVCKSRGQEYCFGGTACGARVRHHGT